LVACSDAQQTAASMGPASDDGGNAASDTGSSTTDAGDASNASDAADAAGADGQTTADAGGSDAASGGDTGTRADAGMPPSAAACSAGDPMLAASGIQIRDGRGQGSVISLRGANLGSWLLVETWMAPVGGVGDDNSMRDTLSSRFGDATKDSLLASYEGAWMQSGDFDNMAALGMTVVRLPFWYLNIENPDGTLRSDAFSELDWAVSEAWKRCIYTVLDLHGAPGGQSGSSDTGVGNSNQLWSNMSDQAHTAAVWKEVAQHFAGNPAVAGYDLLNEPSGAPDDQTRWDIQNTLYQAVRSVDPDHMVFIEAIWNWPNLPPPSMYGWTNVVYELHSYDWDSSLTPRDDASQKATADSEVQDFVSHQSYGVPAFLGEFNVFQYADAWQYTIQQWSQNGINWAMWSWRSNGVGGGVTDSWGVYNPRDPAPPTPDVSNDSAATIMTDWSEWSLGAFGLNTTLVPALAMPVVVGDAYQGTAGAPLDVAAPGVLGNDKDMNPGSPPSNLTAVKVADPSHGTLTLNTDGSFHYVPQAGFHGWDVFSYSASDGHLDSARPGRVVITVP
jgi:aryl-phospho-beta-D-glucosidase BglC (GH1 family)